MSQAPVAMTVVAAVAVYLALIHRAVSIKTRTEGPPNGSRRPTVIALLISASVLLQSLGETRYGVVAPVSLPSLLLTAVNALLLAALAESLLFRLSQRRPPARWTLALGLLPFAGAWALATKLGASEGANSRAWFVWLTFVALVLTLEQGPQLLSVARLLARLVIGASLTAALLWPGWAFAPYATWPGGWRPGIERLQGIFPQPNPLGWFAAFALLVELFGRQASVRSRLLWSSAAGTCLVLSGSRTAAFALLAGVFIGVLTGTPQRKRPLRRLSLTILAAVMLVTGVLAISKASGTTTQGVNGRTHTWALALDVFERNPDFGSGPGAYAKDPGSTMAVPYAHNQLLHTAAELGIAGLLALAWSTIFVAARAFTRMRTPVSASVAGAWLALYGTENLLRFTEMTFFLPVLLAILCWGCTTQEQPAQGAAHLVRSPGRRQALGSESRS
jgi:O-antigen ligase